MQTRARAIGVGADRRQTQDESARRDIGIAGEGTTQRKFG
jgi:hypothetical protein